MARLWTQTLSAGWEFRRDSDETWLSATEVPGDVHTELMRHGIIPDPFVDLNELEVAWVAEQTWRYRTTFSTPEQAVAADDEGENAAVAVDLVFEGLDTFAAVTLNGRTVLESDNMFVEHRVRVGAFSTDGYKNTLEIVFEPARRRGLDLAKAHPEHDFIVHQTEISRGPVRKAQCHFGWDWGPILLGCGPWKPVRLETYVSRVQDVRVDYTVVNLGGQTEGARAEMKIHAQVLGPGAAVEAELCFQGQRVFCFRETSMLNDSGLDTAWTYTSATVKVEAPQLWWPRGYGAQNLYELRVRSIARDGATVLAEERQTVGFRTVELVREADGFGQSFYFRVNGVDVFSGGSCWIPADSFISRTSPQRYRDWIRLVADGNQVMVRVWGGGVYESGAFYAACDELGVLVWQDFMFACASYPTYLAFLRSVETEASQNVRRLRQHPSLVLWCGNNEDYQLVERYGLEYDFDADKDPQSWLKSTFPARYIYEHLLPQVVRDESPDAIYHPGSPWGDGRSTTLKVDATVGDIHQWNVWHGEMRPYQALPDMGGRFVSEFGMEAYPHVDTIERFVTDAAERHPGSATLDFHNKAVGHERRLLAYLTENFRAVRGGDDLASFVHLTQTMQADAMAWAYKSWRRHWGSAGARRCGGVLVWQLNDCWPTVSWAIVDYFLVKKPAYYAVKRALAPLGVAVSRKFYDCTTRPADALWRRDTGHVNPTKALTDIEFDVWVASSRLPLVCGKVVVRFVSIKSGKNVREPLVKTLDVRPNSCTEVVVGYRFETEDGTANREHFVIHASLWVEGEIVGSDTSWPDPIKYLDFADRGVQVKAAGPKAVEVSADKPVKSFVFSERQGVTVSDNGFDLVPGDRPVRVEIEGIEPDKLPWTFVGR
ncbi:glycoside hydrolase family 2 protein [Lasiosphaeria miniovina]|uniref:Beta-mannosidase B n=1 Tax=Lasiosphaeria miniovina TaxID=1954250 RepID=A0AA40A4W6_9PEZI|nr:glycoside hydrolase family 2 protein [Lasiosphaeria miniovina]KAK0709213.1 glycoside hydrolase family 2 protein [Lasiosphaeria miniovina]